MVQKHRTILVLQFIVATNLKFQKRYLQKKIPSFCSAYSAKMFAIDNALERLYEHHRTFNNTLILTDSKFFLGAINNLSHNSYLRCKTICNIKKSTALILYQKPYNINFIWMKGHADIPGNDMADTPAKEATASLNECNKSNELTDIINEGNCNMNNMWKKECKQFV